MSKMNNPSVAVLGLGPMGSAVATALARAGLRTTVWNRTPSRAEPLRDRGVTVAGSAEEAIRSADVTFAVLRDHPTTRDLLASVPADALAGRVVVNAASATPVGARTTAAWAAETGISLLAASIMVPTPLIGTDQALVLYSGPEPLFRRVSGALGALGGTADHVGEDPAAASLLDVAMLEVFFAGMTAFLHAAAMAGAQGVSAVDFLPYARTMVEILPATMEGLAADVDAGTYPGAEDRLAMDLAAMRHVQETSDQAGLDPRLPALLHDLAADAVRAGHADDSWSRVVELLRKPQSQS